MAENLEDFLNPKIPPNTIEVNGSLACQECNEIVSRGYMNEDSMILVYYCSKKHQSKVKL